MMKLKFVCQHTFFTANINLIFPLNIINGKKLALTASDTSFT